MKSIGIVGLPNVGKSTLFNVITNLSVPAENFPFTTIDKNSGIIDYKDPRMEALAKNVNAAATYPAVIQFTDIAGLIKGASKGEGLGNQFLSHIREVDLIMYVLRGFNDQKVTHVYNRVNPREDMADVVTELILRDIESINKKITTIEAQSKKGKSEATQKDIAALQDLIAYFDEGKSAYLYVHEKLQGKEKEPQRQLINELFLLTNKPILCVLNVSYIDMNTKAYAEQVEKWTKEVREYAESVYGNGEAAEIAWIDSRFLADLQSLTSEEVEEFKAELSYFCDVQTLVEMAKRKLKLLNFFVGNEKDARSWFIEEGGDILKAASLIHTSLAQTFVRAQVIKVEDLIEMGTWNKVKEAGKLKTVGKDYVVEDGDYVVILAS
ncbi:MAG: redox-regulated ATPase YchF [Candidatus Dojkabacteria bacterium]|nr:MAG: redox-regulated ATPase YchF [Candidatus Dojkabacteria bacterium]